MKSIHEASSFPQVRLKYLVNRIPGGTPDSRREEFWSDGTIPWISISDMSNRHSVGETAKKITPEARQKAGLEIGPAGTVLFAMYASVGEVAVTEIDAVWNQALIGLVPKSQRLSPSFLHYYLLAVRPYLPALYRSNTQNNLNAEQVENLRLPLPPRSQQEEIVAFLDRETAEIDAFIADQERLIELLEERRAATITHAVTKGLDPNAPMKDSGVESLGDVVAEWEVVAVSRFVSFENGSDYKHVEVAEGGYPVIGSGGEFRRASDYLFDGESVLFGRKGTVDKPLYVTGKFWTVDTMYYTNIDTRYLVPKFLYYWALRIPFDFYLTNTALPSMTQTDLGSAKIALPDRAEQDMIVEYLDRETAEIDAAVSDAQEAIALSRERRTALISAAVSGQLDVTQMPSRGSAGEVLEEEVRV